MGEMEEDSDSEDDEFRMSESDASDVNDEDSEDDYSSEDVSEDEDLSGELDSDESEGKDWSDLEREAAESMKMVMMIIIPEGIGICIRNINIIKGHRSRVHLRHHDDIISIITKAQAHLNLKTITVIVIAIKGNAIIAAVLANTNLTPPKNPNVKVIFICIDIVICILYCKYRFVF